MQNLQHGFGKRKSFSDLYYYARGHEQQNGCNPHNMISRSFPKLKSISLEQLVLIINALALLCPSPIST